MGLSGLQCPFHNLGEKPGAPHAGQGCGNCSIARGKGETVAGTSLTSSAAQCAVRLLDCYHHLGTKPCCLLSPVSPSPPSPLASVDKSSPASNLNHSQDRKSSPTCSGEGISYQYLGIWGFPRCQERRPGSRMPCGTMKGLKGCRVPVGSWFLSTFLRRFCCCCFWSRAKTIIGEHRFSFDIGSRFSQLEVGMDKGQPWKGSSPQPASAIQP